MANNRIGCSAGKTSLIDPNNFSGQGSADNISVPLEDLTISVQLETIKKGRTILTTNNIGENSTKSTQNSNNVRVTFIEGTEIGGQKVLSSKFTDLTTVFDKDNDSSENLGITNIDIDFNSSYAPLITINFLDLRGSSIFQNESQLNNNENKYSVFFQLPYPLYELTIKGYYGKPVKYCLHMTKFNSKFNSQTGNFEITGNFIGYTYAMLSDMLLGILKAIPYTSKGKKKYENLNPKVLNLNELMIKISEIDKNLEKIGANDPDAAKLNDIDSMLEIIALIKVSINALGSAIDYKNDLTGEEAYRYILIQNYAPEPYTSYYDTVKAHVKSYNEKDIASNTSQGLKLDTFDKDKGTNQPTLIDRVQIWNDIKFDDGAYDDFTKNVGDRKDLITTDVASGIIINGYNMGPLFDELNKKRTALQLAKKDVQLKLGDKIKKSITKSLSFEPTIRNIVNTFTVAVEVYLSVMLEVSNEAEEHAERKAQLRKAFNTNGNSDLKTTVKYYPWPDYRENDAKQGYVEKYLGAPGVVGNPLLVDELVFIDDLYAGFLKAKAASDIASLERALETTTWIPVNPFDTLLYNSKSPYRRLPSSASEIDIITLILIRMMIFMGTTHDEELTDAAAVSFIATAEANAILANKNLGTNPMNALVTKFTSIIAGNLGSVVDIENEINGTNRLVIKPSGDLADYYTYNYIFPYPDGKRILPISDSFKGTWPTGLSGLVNKRKDDNSVFLTNYTRVEGKPKEDNGGRYIDIVTLEFYANKLNGKGLITTPINPINVVPYDKLVGGQKEAYSIFNGPYGMQDFKTMDFQKTNLKEAPLMLLFYAEKIFHDITDDSEENKALLASNFVSYGRKPTSEVASFNYLYDYPSDVAVDEVTDSNFVYPINVKSLPSAFTEPIHSNQAGTNILNNRYVLTLDNKTLSYPYVELSIGNKPMSLFGSSLYYRQDNEFSKAFLFLNTLPFNGEPFTDGSELVNLFNKAGGFIHAPRLWCAWVGSLIWRAGLTEKSSNFNKTGAAYNDPISYPTYVNGLKYYKPIGKFKYFKNSLLHDNVVYNQLKIFSEMSDFFKFLPQQVLDEFYDSFYSFVENRDSTYTSWDSIRTPLELLNIKNQDGTTDYAKTYNDFIGIVDRIYGATYTSAILGYDVNPVPINEINNFDNIVNYNIITPIPEFSYTVDNDYNNDALFLELKGNYGDDNDVVGSSNGVKNIIDALKQEVIIVNSGYGAWTRNAKVLPIQAGYETTLENKQNIVVRKDLVEAYLLAMKPIILTYAADAAAATIKNKQEVFGTDSEEVIKLQLYRTCKNVYDKWIGNATDGENIIFQCGGVGTPTRHNLDSKLANKRGGSDAKLIDSFRFVTRSFRDIGDDFFIDPRPVSTYLTDNPNASFYGCVTDLLAANNFDFIALPSFINYNNKETMESIFDTYTYQESIKKGFCGPSFVCVYVGQKSKHLDFEGSDYTNDGFDVQCNSGGGMRNGLPKDFINNSEDYENDVAVFKVAYSQQNQNIFKDITLDQSEFSETEESLKIIDDISKTGSENQRHFGGQNLYSVYGVRSYKTEVEMMGNAMIQPMMYFQLDNIPMFHGAYMITHVKHNLKPNYMSTNFTGVRIRFPETPLLKANELYMSLLDGVDITATPSKPVVGCAAKDLATLTTKGTAYDANQLKVKNIAKSLGLNKVQTAAMMGNIMQESGFNPIKFNNADYGGTTDLGLIQWNSKYTPPPKGSNPGQANLTLSKQMFINYLGDTVEKQMKFVPTTNYYTDWIADKKNKTDVRYSTWNFGRLVEICHNCADRSYFETNKEQCKRTPYAEDFLKRFNDSTDPLKW